MVIGMVTLRVVYLFEEVRLQSDFFDQKSKSSACTTSECMHPSIYCIAFIA